MEELLPEMTLVIDNTDGGVEKILPLESFTAVTE